MFIPLFDHQSNPTKFSRFPVRLEYKNQQFNLEKGSEGMENTKSIFVIMPFSSTNSHKEEEWTEIYEEIFKPAIEDCDYLCERAIPSTGSLIKSIIEKLKNSNIVLADITDRNPNVFYELGVRHCLNKRTIIVSQKEEDIPSDLKGYWSVIYGVMPKGVSKFKNDIRRIISEIERDPERSDNPVSDFLDLEFIVHDRTKAIFSEVESLRNKVKQLEFLLDEEKTGIKGKRLFQHKGYYPIELDEDTNIPRLNRDIYIEAMKYLLKDKNYDRLAAMDLVYLRKDNIIDKGDILTDADLELYENIIRKYDLFDYLEKFDEENKKIFNNFIRIVNDIGETFKDVYMEILLHNVRNPLRSIIACRNSENISGRKMFDPSTRFVVQFVRNQGRMLYKAMEGGSKVSYFKQFNKEKNVKATTIPFYHEKYGLIGILCINIDIDSINQLDDRGKEDFFKKYIKNSGHTPDFEKKAFGLK